MSTSQTPFAISGIKEPQKIRVLIYANNEIAHAPLNAILQAGITSGSNENGDFTRFADGTQICWANSATSIRRNNSSSFDEWVFPAAFVSTPVVTVTALAGQASGSTMINLIDAIRVQFNSNIDQASGAAVSLQRMAIGRWF